MVGVAVGVIVGVVTSGAGVAEATDETVGFGELVAVVVLTDGVGELVVSVAVGLGELVVVVEVGEGELAVWTVKTPSGATR